MNKTTQRFIFWTPRVICILFAFFTSLFALDVFSEGLGFWKTFLALIMHLIPTWIILNARKEPLVWATTQYRYTFGPMKRFGNLRVPDWAVYGNGTTRYQMISLQGSHHPPDLSLFSAPADYPE